ncbi:uncharacterized protein LOC131331104 [Rhododendron vialii]|uniref:uncharacterized protein LOC131331104 n=1 Tax=Rhododendron vialii TaxID=182163 RepID=UPI00265F96FB|nr:uncharacterized protein LOC131331104 [Rhododendron vialii]
MSGSGWEWVSTDGEVKEGGRRGRRRVFGINGSAILKVRRASPTIVAIIHQNLPSSRWGLEAISGVHNHEIANHIEGHEYPSRLKPIEKQFVVDMANSSAPREILNILKQKDPSNTMGIKSVYNAIFVNKAAKLDGLTPIQYVISQLLKKDYLHQFLTNPYTNEITDII